MPFIRVPKLSGPHPLVLATAVQVRLHWTFNGIVGFNVLGGIVGGGFINTQVHADALDAAVKGHYTSSGLKALQPGTTVLVAASIRDVRVANQVEYVGTNATIAGTGAGDALPNQLAGVVTLRTGLAGKSFRGRVYFSGGNEAQNDATGKIVAAYNTALLAFMTGVQSDMGAEGITLAVLSRPRFANLAPPNDVMIYPGAINIVTSMTTRDVEWDTQRRRKR